jgi:hypothetical protein
LAIRNPQNAPKREANAPKWEENAPKWDENAPKWDENVPKREENAPKWEENAPTREENAPKREENAPKREENAPGQERGTHPPFENVSSVGQKGCYGCESASNQKSNEKHHHWLLGVQAARNGVVVGCVEPEHGEEKRVAIDGVAHVGGVRVVVRVFVPGASARIHLTAAGWAPLAFMFQRKQAPSNRGQLQPSLSPKPVLNANCTEDWDRMRGVGREKATVYDAVWWRVVAMQDNGQIVGCWLMRLSLLSNSGGWWLSKAMAK